MACTRCGKSKCHCERAVNMRGPVGPQGRPGRDGKVGGEGTQGNLTYVESINNGGEIVRLATSLLTYQKANIIASGAGAGTRYLSTDSSGNLSWVSGAGGGIPGTVTAFYIPIVATTNIDGTAASLANSSIRENNYDIFINETGAKNINLTSFSGLNQTVLELKPNNAVIGRRNGSTTYGLSFFGTEAKFSTTSMVNGVVMQNNSGLQTLDDTTSGYLFSDGAGAYSWQTVSGGGTTTNPLTIGTGLSGTSFDGSAPVTIAIDSSVVTLTGAQALSNKTGLISQWTNDSGYLTSVTNISGNAATATALQTARAINGTNFDGTASITVTAAAGTLTGTTLNATVVSSSLTSVGTLSSGALATGFTAVGATIGGTGQSTYTTGDTLYASATNTISKLSAGATAGMFLRNGGASTAPTWSTLVLPNTISSTSIPFATGANTIGSNSSFIYSQDATKSLGVTGSNSARVSIEVQNTNSAGNASFYFQNNRGSFATYGGVLTCGSTESGSLLGVTRADRTFLISDGASSNGLAVGTLTADAMVLGTNNATRVTIPSAGGVVIGTAALATNATDGFLYIPTCAGTPTGVPVAQTGTVAIVFDTTNSKLYIYNGAWLGGTVPGAFI